MILNLISDNVPILNSLFDYISNIGYQPGIPLLLTIRLAILILFVVFALNYLLKIYNKKRLIHKQKSNKLKMYDKFKLIPKEYTDKILLIILKHRKLTWCEICINLNDNKPMLLKHILISFMLYKIQKSFKTLNKSQIL